MEPHIFCAVVLKHENTGHVTNFPVYLDRETVEQRIVSHRIALPYAVAVLDSYYAKTREEAERGLKGKIEKYPELELE